MQKGKPGSSSLSGMNIKNHIIDIKWLDETHLSNTRTSDHNKFYRPHV